MKYFGTDGIRGVVGKNLCEQIIKKVACGIVRYFNKTKLKRQILVGNDSRISSDYILSVLNSVLLKNGIDVDNVGICTSPALAFLARKHAYPLAIMLSASHNPSEYNGIKFFNSAGEKVDNKFEQQFETLMDKKTRLKNCEHSKCKPCEKLLDGYYHYLKSFVVKKDVIFDCAFGGAAKILDNVLPKSNRLHTHFNGKNINCCAGCTQPEKLIMQCKIQGKIGFAFDGDADRVLAVDEMGNCYDGDALLFLFSKFFLNKKDCLVGTIYTNTGLENALSKNNITLVRAEVGDKHVLQKMKETNCKLGGEKSGHIILTQYTHTGDGILAALLVMRILNLTKLNLSKLFSEYTPYFQAHASVDINGVSENQIKKLKINSASKIIIRSSGTEPILRIMVEDKNEKIAKNLLNSIKNELILHKF